MELRIRMESSFEIYYQLKKSRDYSNGEKNHWKTINYRVMKTVVKAIGAR